MNGQRMRLVGTPSTLFRAAAPTPGRIYRRRSAISDALRGHAHRHGTENGLSKKTAVVIVDHGSRREESNLLLYRVVESFQHQSKLEVVEAAHMDVVKPNIADALCACVEQGAEHVVVSPFFLSPGRHSQQDIPLLVEEAIEMHNMDISYSIADPLGMDPLIIDILQQRVMSVLKADSGNE